MSDASADVHIEANVHDSPRLDDAAAYRIHRTNRLLLTHLGRFLETSQRGLTPEKGFILARLREDGPLRQVELTEPALEDAPNVSRLVESLVEAKLVERQPDPNDRQSRVLSLSVDGTTLADELHERAVMERRRVFNRFSSADLKTLTEPLDQLDTNVRSTLANEPPR